jgi:hypothetical protein
VDDVRREDLVGLTWQEAEELAQSRGWRTRVLRPGSIVTMEHREDRLNLHVAEDGDVVVDVSQG